MGIFTRFFQGLAIRRKLRNFATDLLPALHSNIDILAINVDAVADALAQAGCAPNSAGIAELLPQGVHIEDFGHLRLLRTCRGSYC